MGLDITAYSHVGAFLSPDINALENLTDAGTACRIWVNPTFPGRALPLTQTGVYAVPDEAIKFRFHVGTYSYYGNWREQLARLAGYPQGDEHGDRVYSAGAWEATEGPFWELINFSDYTGVIGAGASERLVRDFFVFKEKSLKEDPEFRDTYNKFMLAFKAASKSGVVIFH